MKNKIFITAAAELLKITPSVIREHLVLPKSTQYLTSPQHAKLCKDFPLQKPETILTITEAAYLLEISISHVKQFFVNMYGYANDRITQQEYELLCDKFPPQTTSQSETVERGHPPAYLRQADKNNGGSDAKNTADTE